MYFVYNAKVPTAKDIYTFFEIYPSTAYNLVEKIANLSFFVKISKFTHLLFQ